MCVTTRAAVYLRISLDKNGDGLAVERQKAECLRIVRERGWTLTEIYEDASVSAFRRNVKRPAYDRLVADYAAGKFDAIAVYDLDRFTRQPRQLEDWIEAAEDRGLVLVTADGQADLGTDNGRLFARLKAGVARSEMERKSARQKAKNSQNVALGRPVPGRRRFGFEPGNIVERPEEAEEVRRVFAEVLDGASLFSIAKRLGKPPVRVREMLTNPGYAGWVVRKGERFEAAPEVARIISREDFEKVQTLLADPSRKTTPGPRVRHLASGIARCGVCDARMVKASDNYLCKANLSHPTIRVKMLDDLLETAALIHIVNQDQTPSGAVADLVTELTALTARRASWQEQATWPGADMARIRTEVAKLGKEVEKVEAELARVRSSAIVSDVMGLIRSDLGDAEAAEGWTERWAGMTLETKRQLIGSLSIRVHPGRGVRRVEVEGIEWE